jgi:chromosome segregation ATPase
MPRRKSDREAWEEELNELPALLSKLHRELAATPEKTDEDLDRRETLQWKIRRVEHRIVDLRSRLTTDDAPDRDDQENTR